MKTMKRRMELIHLRLAICREGDAWVVLEERAVLVEDLHLAGLIEDLMEDDEALGFLNREGTEKQKREQGERGQIREERVGSNKLTGRSLLRPIYREQGNRTIGGWCAMRSHVKRKIKDKGNIELRSGDRGANISLGTSVEMRESMNPTDEAKADNIKISNE